jgi:hypothetical protein
VLRTNKVEGTSAVENHHVQLTWLGGAPRLAVRNTEEVSDVEQFADKSSVVMH